jgi:hypothetical protein
MSSLAVVLRKVLSHYQLPGTGTQGSIIEDLSLKMGDAFRPHRERPFESLSFFLSCTTPKDVTNVAITTMAPVQPYLPVAWRSD